MLVLYVYIFVIILCRLDELELKVQEITKHWLTDNKESLHENCLKWEEHPCVEASRYCLAKFSDGK